MMRPVTQDAYRLFHEGALALAQVERNGIRVDEGYLAGAITQVESNIRDLERELRDDLVVKEWQKRFGRNTNLQSGEQLAEVLFGCLKLPYTFERTAGGKYRTDETILSTIDLPFVKKYLRIRKLKKLLSTYLRGIQREVVAGLLHPVFNLHTVITFRGSSDQPNFQNIPIRDPEIGAIIRKAFVPRKGWISCEADFGALEFRIAAYFWKDPRMVEYARDPTKDIHRDMAARLYACKPEQVSKPMRQTAKNQFVFPVLYGSYYLPCSKGLWDPAAAMKLQDGTDLLTHLRKKGIKKLGVCDAQAPPVAGTFEYHVKEVEAWFFNHFSKLKEKKETWWNEYLTRGWFRLMTGFVVRGIYSRNFLMNCPVQGPGFHCLLWSLVELLKWLKKRKMRTMITGQIHDCQLTDGPEKETQDVLGAIHDIMTNRLRKAWSWIVGPMDVEVDLFRTSWHEKKPWVLKDGIWVPKE